MLSHLRDEMMGLWVPIATKLIAGLIGPGAVTVFPLLQWLQKATCLCLVLNTRAVPYMLCCPVSLQEFVASALGVPSNRIVVRVKRMGGGFGGKETRSTILTTAVSVAAFK